MARIRTIKPDFWSDGKVVGLSPEARLLFIGSWNFALCDDGHLPDDPMGLKLKVLPADQVDGVVLLEELLAAGVVVRGATPDGRSYLHVPRLRDHQKVDNRWTPRCFVCSSAKLPSAPSAPSDSPSLPETRASFTEPHRASPSLTAVKERKGKEEKKDLSGKPDEAPGFAEFYAAYPRKEARRKAEQAWRAAIKRATPEDIMAGLARFPFKPERQYQPLPASWLNADRWADEAPTVAMYDVNKLPEPGEGWSATQLDMVLGKDDWTVPEPPADMDADAGYMWQQQQQRRHFALRVQAALEAVGRSA
jgi:hypothetical protein